MTLGQVFLAIGAVIAALFVLRLIASGRVYRQLFAPAHYRELAAALPAATATALDRIDEPPDAPLAAGDPRVIHTTAGLAVFVTIRREDGMIVHHVSVSLMGRYTPHAVGRPLVVFVAERLGWDLRAAGFAFSEHNVFHGELTLDARAHEAWTQRPAAPELDEHVHARARSLGDAVEFTQLPPLPLGT